jgi:hypothetical protein
VESVRRLVDKIPTYYDAIQHAAIEPRCEMPKARDQEIPALIV